jgi:hypothetical protein
LLGKSKKILRWPLDGEDTSVYGGSALLSAGCGVRWGWEIGLIVIGAALMSIALAPHVLAALSGRRGNAR